MIRDDRELLAELARLNTDMPSLALRIMGGSVTASEQWHYGQWLIAAGQRSQRRTEGTGGMIIEGGVIGENLTALSQSTAEPVDWHAGEPSELTGTE